MNLNNYRLLYKEENGLDIYAIKTDNGKICLYWKNKNSSNINNIIVIFNNSNNVKISNNQLCISLDGVNNISDIKIMLTIFYNEIRKIGIDITKIKVTFVIDNPKQKDELDTINMKMGLNVEYKKGNNYQEEKANKRIIENNEQKSNLALEKAYQEDGNMNAELGIVQNNIANPNKYSVVEQDSNGQARIANPTVTNTSINSKNGINNTNTSNYGYQTQDANTPNEQEDINIDEEQIESREIVNIYYLDDDGKTILDDRDNVIGTIGTEGYLNYDDKLYQNGQLIGKLGEKSQNKSNSQGRARVYKPETSSYHQPKKEKNAAFISLPVIIFIISLILLIGSGIILFLMK